MQYQWITRDPYCTGFRQQHEQGIVYGDYRKQKEHTHLTLLTTKKSKMKTPGGQNISFIGLRKYSS